MKLDLGGALDFWRTVRPVVTHAAVRPMDHGLTERFWYHLRGSMDLRIAEFSPRNALISVLEPPSVLARSI